MTSCARYPNDDVLWQYVNGGLPESIQASFEDHLFECDACLARVERYQAAMKVRDERVLPSPTAAPVRPPAHARTRRRAAPAHVLRWALPVAAAIVVGLAAFVLPDGTEAPAPLPAGLAQAPATREPAAAMPRPRLQVAVLAMVTPPAPLPSESRGTREDDRFVEAMAAYARADWPGASRALRALEAPPARFYLAISDLMRGDAPAAASSLEAVRRSGQSPYAGESLFYLGKAALQIGDVTRAREWFAAARDADAGPDHEAVRLLAALDEIEAN